MSYQPCPPSTPQPCPQACPPPPPAPPCRVKPIMRGLHRAQTKALIAQGTLLAFIGGAAYYVLISAPRIAAYKDFYAKGEFEDWADEMARKGLFQSVPVESLKDNQHMNK
ncbi:cytochrome c oxidase subunit 6C-like [Achroia grisella]|uniref:cytochrome c oxidase subunit 6C-like n=1 Tax=Achroia grisella TaxID=688607 RepID=UPI0027D27B63|nr:cytochrome c oxidase subunit 6C-like [Achroia grisella]XP_059055629.1 cytochrome c oxidase subunit 6C-like [Achroia grisella]